jgi:deazaflavin-dependent oxidoreductase (nitroreductase family)
MVDDDRPIFGDEHVRAYEETDGAVGYIWQGHPTLILSTTGRVTGKVRKHALLFGRDGDDIVIVASKGGYPDNPQWYENLCADPVVGVQIESRRFRASARTADRADKQRLWSLMTEIWPSYDDYQKRTERDIPVVILTPEE